MDTREYDVKLARIQAKRILKKILNLCFERTGQEVVIELQDIKDSFNFFCDIIHLLDDDIELINIDRAKPGKEG